MSIPTMSWCWTNERGQQGTASVDGDGQLQLDVDDDWYSGELSRADSVELARAILAAVPAAVEDFGSVIGEALDVVFIDQGPGALPTKATP